MENLFSLSAVAVATIPVIVGLVSVLKPIGLPSKYAPVVSIVLGMCLVALTGSIWQNIVAQGILVGLAASGLYSGGKAIVSPAN